MVICVNPKHKQKRVDAPDAPDTFGAYGYLIIGIYACKLVYSGGV